MPLISPLMPVPQYGVLVNVGMENAERIKDGPNSRAENKRYDRQTFENPMAAVVHPVLILDSLSCFLSAPSQRGSLLW